MRHIHSIYISKLYSKKDISNPTTLLCNNCVSWPKYNETFALGGEGSDLNLIHLADRGGLKYPPDEAVNTLITLWKILKRIGQDNRLMRQLLAAASKPILSQLSISRIEFKNSDFWRIEYHSCLAPFHCYLSKILSTTSNCSLRNKVRNKTRKVT
ncbi:hypothetical protein LOD99_9168 [Oopsacas minuta]|uniref:Uncharacterized protein n=1 Tax=Oopsacas minuta TaxID=111878 RepID=A0AAV7JDT8_9METZ|nr:hypothetical protein LOD99_9168 [Oopsacas minuta]